MYTGRYDYFDLRKQKNLQRSHGIGVSYVILRHKHVGKAFQRSTQEEKQRGKRKWGFWETN